MMHLVLQNGSPDHNPSVNTEKNLSYTSHTHTANFNSLYESIGYRYTAGWVRLIFFT